MVLSLFSKLLDKFILCIPRMRQIGEDVVKTYSSIFFLEATWPGILILASTWTHPKIAICGLIAVLSALIMSRLIQGRMYPFRERTILCNSLLIGLFIGYLFRLDAIVIAMIVLFSIVSIMFTLFFEAFLAHQWLPIISIPFTVAAALLALAGKQFSNLLDATPYFLDPKFRVGSNLLTAGISETAEAFLRSIGAVLCIPDPVFGGILILIVTVTSPLIGISLVSGFLIGISVEELLHLGPVSFASASHYFSYSLSFTAIVVVFLVPSRFSVIVATIGTILTCLVALAASSLLEPLHVPMTALPFNFVVLNILRSIRSVRPLNISVNYSGTPEETLDRSRLYWLRHRGGEHGLFCPFSGSWMVQQGFDGPWTHRGWWQHALDFVKIGQDGKTFTERGAQLTDYYAFGQDVLSPVDGYVSDVCSDQPDNPIGRVENQKNWGNYVVIRTAAGYWVVLAHLKKNSVCVKVGDPVLPGAKVGECGNSGYSQEPHLHLQIQYSPLVGSYTTPFHLLNFSNKERILFHQVPQANEVIEPLSFNLALERVLTFRIGDKFLFERIQDGTRSDIVVMVGLSEVTGLLYFDDEVSRLYFSRVGTQFYFFGHEGSVNSLLAHLFLSAPRIPITFGKSLAFSDELPLRLTHRRWWRLSKLMLNLVLRSIEVPFNYTFHPDSLEVRGRIKIRGEDVESYLALDPILGFRELRLGDTRYVRVIS